MMPVVVIVVVVSAGVVTGDGDTSGGHRPTQEPTISL
jgi:hypothetical protein